MKICSRCKLPKSLNEFYVSSQSPDGAMGKCKECKKVEARAYYREKHEERREYDRKRTRTATRRAAKLEYQRRRRKNKSSHYRANMAVNNAIRDGRLKRGPCEKCGAIKAEAHHDDYSKPLEVRWLCLKHHREHHGRAI